MRNKDYPEYKTYQSMLERCRERHHRSKYYFGKGIGVCDEWKGIGGFKRFIDHVGRRPAKEYSLDRIDNDLGYFPGNVRWATVEEQTRNRTDNIWVEVNGQRMILCDAAKVLGIGRKTLYARRQLGWSIEKVLNTPLYSNEWAKREGRRPAEMFKPSYLFDYPDQ
jgi:hypothetical protein